MSLIATSKLKTSTNYLSHLSINTSIVQIMESMLDSYVHVFEKEALMARSSVSFWPLVREE